MPNFDQGINWGNGKACLNLRMTKQEDIQLDQLQSCLLPDQHHSLDWMGLAGDSEIAYLFIKALLTEGTASVELRPSASQEERLWHFFFEQRTATRHLAKNVLFFSYPFFIGWNEAGLFGIPLLRWACTLIPPKVGQEVWVLQTHQQTASPEVHEDWCAWAAAQHDEDWASLLNRVKDGKQGLQALADFCIRLTDQTGWSTSTVHPAISSFPSTQTLSTAARQGTLLWSASLGLSSAAFQRTVDPPAHWRYPIAQEDSAIRDYELGHLDAWQYTALRILGSHRYTQVIGSPGTGKTHLLVECIKLALTQQKTILVVAKELSKLEDIRNQLIKLNLDALSFLYRDPVVDQVLLKGLVKAYERQPLAETAEQGEQWDSTLAKLKRESKLREEQYALSRKKIFGDQSWSELLGYYLAASRREGKEVLASQLTAGQFSFFPQEYQTVVQGIQQTAPLYHQIGSIHHSLSNLNSAIFIHQEEEESQEFVRSTTSRLLSIARPLHQRYSRRQSLYADQLLADQEAYYRELSNQLQQLDHRLEDGLNELGEDLLRSSDRTLKLYGVFGQKFRQTLDVRASLEENLQTLQELHDARQVFAFTWPSDRLSRKPLVLRNLLKDYREQLLLWQTNRREQVKEELIRLNHKTALPSLAASKGIEELEQELEVFIDEVNAVGLYQLPFQSKTLTLNRQQKYLEEIIEQLEKTHDGLTNYSSYYHWQRNWFALPELSRKVIAALIKTRPSDWEAAFSSWYFNECLSLNYAPTFAASTANDQLFSATYRQLQSRLPAWLRFRWYPKKAKAAGQLRFWARNENTSQDWQAFWREKASSLTAFAPVFLTTPDLAGELAPYFSLVLLEDGHQLTQTETEMVLAGAPQALVVADPGQDGGETGAVSTVLSRGNMPTLTLAQAYTPSYVGRLFQDPSVGHYYQLDGRFSPETRTNEAEAQEIIRLLNTIKATPQRTFPRVGVACLTAEQRNLILSYFYRIKKNRQAGFDTIQQLERNGLEVFDSQELTGTAFDIVIVSGVYGPVNIENHLTDQLKALNRRSALAGLRRLSHRFSQQIHIVSSLPQDELQTRLLWEDCPGEQALARLFLACWWAQQGEIDRLADLEKQINQRPQPPHDGDSLAREMFYRLGEQLPAWDWRFDFVRDFQVPLLQAVSPRGKITLLLPDGFLAQSLYTQPSWELDRQEKLRLLGYQLVSFATDDLWKDPARTCLRIVQQLSILDEEE